MNGFGSTFRIHEFALNMRECLLGLTYLQRELDEEGCPMPSVADVQEELARVATKFADVFPDGPGVSAMMGWQDADWFKKNPDTP